MIRTTLLTFGSMYCIFRLHARFGLIVLCAFPFLVGTLALCLAKANPLFSRLQAQLDAINAIMQEDVSGIRTIKACVREAYKKVRFGKANDELIKTQLKTLVIFAFMNPVVNAPMYVVVALILPVGSFESGGFGATPGNTKMTENPPDAERKKAIIRQRAACQFPERTYQKRRPCQSSSATTCAALFSILFVSQRNLLFAPAYAILLNKLPRGKCPAGNTEERQEAAPCGKMPI